MMGQHAVLSLAERHLPETAAQTLEVVFQATMPSLCLTTGKELVKKGVIQGLAHILRWQ